MIIDLPTKRILALAITVTNISQSFYLQRGGKNQLAYIWNIITLLSPYAYKSAVDIDIDKLEPTPQH